MPSKERFQTRPCGRVFNAVLGVNLSVSSWTAAEVTQNEFSYWLWSVPDSSFLDRTETSEDATPWQEPSATLQIVHIIAESRAD